MSVTKLSASHDPIVTPFHIFRRDLPKLNNEPPITIPEIEILDGNDNPFILKNSNSTYTVFIIFVSTVSAIILIFVSYYLIFAFAASRLAKKTIENDKMEFNDYNNSNNSFYATKESFNNLRSNVLLGYKHHQSIFNLPLLSKDKVSFSKMNTNNNRSLSNIDLINVSNSFNHSSLIFNDKSATSDLTKMFISPTAEVMHKKRIQSFHNLNTQTNLNYMNLNKQSNSNYMNFNTKSTSNLSSKIYSNRYSQFFSTNFPEIRDTYHPEQMNSIPNLTANDILRNNQNCSSEIKKSKRQTVPSIYLDDLINNDD